MLGNVSCFCYRLPLLLFFQNLNFQQQKIINTIRVSNSLNQDQDHYSVGQYLGTNCSQGLSADDKKNAAGKERVKQASKCTADDTLIFCKTRYNHSYEWNVYLL